MIQMHLLSVQIQILTFMRILTIITQTQKENLNCVWWLDCRYNDKQKTSSHD